MKSSLHKSSRKNDSNNNESEIERKIKDLEKLLLERTEALEEKQDSYE